MGKKLTALDQLKTSMARAKGWASNQVAQVAQAAAEAMEELDGVKADKSEGVAVTIPTTGWSPGQRGVPLVLRHRRRRGNDQRPGRPGPGPRQHRRRRRLRHVPGHGDPGG